MKINEFLQTRRKFFLHILQKFKKYKVKKKQK